MNRRSHSELQSFLADAIAGSLIRGDRWGWL
jgi:hypothetical protein